MLPQLSTRRTVLPNAWQGGNCLVGPFSSQTVAEYFATHVANIGDHGATATRVVVERDSLFVKVEAY